MLKVVADLVEASRVFDVVDANFNQPSVLCEDEMVSRLVMREAHDLVAARVHCRVMLRCGAAVIHFFLRPGGETN